MAETPITVCLGFCAGLYFPPFQAQTVINQAKSLWKNTEITMKFLSQVATLVLIAALGSSSFAQTDSSTQAPVPAQSNQASQAPPSSKLADGTPIKLRLARTISSANARIGDTVGFEVLEDVKVGAAIVIARGGIAWANVTDAKPKRRIGRAGKLNLNIDAVLLLTGERVPLRAIKETQGDGRKEVMAGAMVVTAIVFPPAAPLFLFVKGRDITIPQGTEITAYINGDFPLDLGKFTTASSDRGPIAPKAQEATSGQEASTGNIDFSSVMIKSIPEGAEILIDGKVAGNTPSTLRLKHGEHTISIRKSGFVLWERKITISAGIHILVDAALEKTP
jgi:PEGA domain-containing protein